ncbi:MAG: class I SAM-dependent methyltransferase [Chitinophagaceae bacterium]
MDIITYSHCPCCGSDAIFPKITAKDYTVSGDKFEIWQCQACTARFTQNIPGRQFIGTYYQSENYISHTDTKKGFINSLYHLVRKRTLHQKQKQLEKITGITNGSLLDIGAGTGAFSRYMKNAGWSVLGLEPDEATRQRALELYSISLKSMDELFTLSAESFDAVTMWHVLEHVHSLHEYLNQINIVLKLQGRAFIAVPNYTSYDAVIYREFWAAYDVPRHLYHFSPLSMKLLVEKHAMKLYGVQPMWYDSFYVSMLSQQYKTGVSGNLQAFKNGLLSNLKASSNHEKCSSLIYIIGKE